MKSRHAVLPLVVSVVLLSVGHRGTAAEASDGYGFSQRGGAAQFTGFPVSPEFSVSGGYGILRFGVSTKDMTLTCYDQGTNIAVLQDIRDRLVEVIAWNGERLREGREPLPIVVVGVFDLRESTVLVTEIQIPRVGERNSGEAVGWDRLDPNLGDEPLPYDRSDHYYEPTVYEPYDPYAGAVIIPQVVNNYYYVEPDSGRYGYYPYYSGYSRYYRPAYSHQPSYCAPVYRPSRHESRASCDTSLGRAEISYHTLTMPRAERWGLTGQISRNFTHPVEAWSFKKYLNPSQLQKSGERPDRQRPSRFSSRDRDHHRHSVYTGYHSANRSGGHSSGRSGRTRSSPTTTRRHTGRVFVGYQGR